LTGLLIFLRLQLEERDKAERGNNAKEDAANQQARLLSPFANRKEGGEPTSRSINYKGYGNSEDNGWNQEQQLPVPIARWLWLRDMDWRAQRNVSAHKGRPTFLAGIDDAQPAMNKSVPRIHAAQIKAAGRSHPPRTSAPRRRKD
jgi:hypothetical protein